jgi:hypothetical protein
MSHVCAKGNASQSCSCRCGTRKRRPTRATGPPRAPSRETSPNRNGPRPRPRAALPAADAPEPTECQSSCRNLAYTDRDVTTARHQLARLQQTADSPLAPRPLRDRAAGQAARLQAIIDRHEGTRPGIIGQERSANGPRAT